MLNIFGFRMQTRICVILGKGFYFCFHRRRKPMNAIKLIKIMFKQLMLLEQERQQFYNSLIIQFKLTYKTSKFHSYDGNENILYYSKLMLFCCQKKYVLERCNLIKKELLKVSFGEGFCYSFQQNKSIQCRNLKTTGHTNHLKKDDTSIQKCSKKRVKLA